MNDIKRMLKRIGKDQRYFKVNKLPNYFGSCLIMYLIKTIYVEFSTFLHEPKVVLRAARAIRPATHNFKNFHFSKKI